MFPLLRRWIHDAEENPRVQIAIHKAAMLFWLINVVLVALAYFLLPGIWLKVSVFYLAIISIYANFATDYDALSAAQASQHAIEARDRAEGKPDATNTGTGRC